MTTLDCDNNATNSMLLYHLSPKSKHLIESAVPLKSIIIKDLT